MVVKAGAHILKGDEIFFNADLGGIGKIYFDYMKTHSQKIAQIDAKSGKTDTFDELLERCVRTAIEMKKRGIKKGDKMSIFSYNHLNVCVPLIAAHFIGVIPCPLDPILSCSETTYLIKYIQPKIIFTSDEFVKMIKTATKNAGVNTDIVVFGKSEENASFDNFLKPQQNESEFLPIIINNPKETAIILFSSGTSGLPKGICLSHSHLLHESPLNSKPNDDPNEEYIKSMNPLYTAGKAIYLSYSSLYWVSAITSLRIFTIMGQPRLICLHFDAKELWHLIDKYKVAILFLGGTHFIEFSNSERPQIIDTSSLKMIVSSGSVIPKKFIILMRKLLPNTSICQGYSQTETGNLTAFFFNNILHARYCLEKPDSVGLPVDGKIYRIVDPETEETLGPNQPGELRIKWNHIMNGYYNMDCSDRYDRDGWFKTGDILYYDEDQCFFFVDRIKEIFKFRGIHVQPAILEAELLKHPAVKEAAVIGKPHEEDGDHPMAIVILKEDATNTTAEEIQQFVDNQLDADAKKLRGGVKIVKEFPKTPSGKINRRILKQIILTENIQTQA